LKNQSISAILCAFKRQILTFKKVYLITLIFIFLVWFTSEASNISIYNLVADPNEIGHLPPYAGIVSNLGIWLWCSGASICFFTYYLIDPKKKQDREWKLFFQFSACLLLLLLLDDALQIHENFSNLLFGVDAQIAIFNKKLQSILESLVFLLYTSLFIFYGFRFRKVIYNTEIFPLILTVIFLALSFSFDILPEDIKGHFILEEGFKLLGIVSLVIYYVNACYQKVK
jgi:hypothetical protein